MKDSRIRQFFVAILVALSTCAQAAPTTKPMTRSASTAPTPSQQTEVVIVGTQHFITDMPDGYTPGHLRALLDKIDPAAVLVEAATNVPDPWATAPYELSAVTRPWATARKVPAIPVGHVDERYASQIGEMFAAIAKAGKADVLNGIESRFQSDLAQLGATCAAMNGRPYADRWRRYHAELHRLSGADTPWERLNAKIVANALDACRQHRGKRVAVVFGAAHAYFLADELSKDPAVRVIPAETFFPLSDEDIRARTTDADHVRSMRRLNFPPGALPREQLDELERNLARLKATGKHLSDVRYFSAKLLMHRGKPAEALKTLDELSSSAPRESVLTFDGTTPIRDAARLQACLALQQQGDGAAAAKRLRQLANDATVSRPIREAAKSMLQAAQAR